MLNQTVVVILWITLKYLPLIIFIWIPILLYYYFLNKLSYWKSHNVPYIPGLPFIGNYKSLITYQKDMFDHLREFYFHPTFRNKPIIGYFKFHKNALIIRDIELIKQILIRDFQKFPNRNARSSIHSDEMGATCLFLARNRTWKTLRNRTSPCFSFNRVRKMFELINGIGNELNQYLVDSKLNGTIVEFKEVAACYTTDIVASCAFGVSVNSLRNPSNGFRKAGSTFFQFTLGRALELFCFMILPDFAALLKLKFFTRDIEKFFRQSIHHIMTEREKSGTERNDLIDALIELKNEDKEKTATLTNELVFKGDVLVAQPALFLAAGFETSSTLIAFTLFQLAWNPSIQDRVREEIQYQLKKNNSEKLTIEMINQMEYLDMICSETLRYYPPVPFMDRECYIGKNEDSYSLEPYSTFKIPNGMPIIIPIAAIHHDPKYFPNPNVYDPERFSVENKKNIIPGTYFPFGLGPRKCVADYLGLVLSKIGIINVIRNHYLKPSKKTPRQLKLNKRSFAVCAENGIHLEIYRI